jgi:predicted transcriptional regulator
MSQDDLLRCLVHIVARATTPEDTIRTLIGKGKNRVRAFNLCDGAHSMTEIAHKTKIDQGNLSRAVKRWIESGIVFSLGEGKDARPLHAYSIPEKPRKRGQLT